MLIAKMSRAANQPVLVGTRFAVVAGLTYMKPVPGEDRRYLSAPPTRKSGARASTSIGRAPTECAVAAGDLDRGCQVDVRAVAVADVGDRDDGGAAVDRALQFVEVEHAGGVRGDRADLGAAALLRVPDLCGRGEVEVGRDDDAALAAEVHGARDRAQGDGGGRGERDVLGAGVQQPADEPAHLLLLADPGVPVRALRLKVRQVVLVGRAHDVGQRALGAAVDVGQGLEDREPVADRVGQRGCRGGAGHGVSWW
jgi:hypothetical protein